jgi:hypothetical protein
MECPFCGSEMEPGTVKLRTLHPLSTSLSWTPQRDQGEPQRVMKAGLFGRRGREGSYCYGCDAVVLDPVPPDWQ